MEQVVFGSLSGNLSTLSPRDWGGFGIFHQPHSGSLPPTKVLELNNWISCWRKAAQSMEMMMLHRGVGPRMFLDKDKAPGGSTGAQIHGFLIQGCALVPALTDQTVNSDCSVLVTKTFCISPLCSK